MKTAFLPVALLALTGCGSLWPTLTTASESPAREVFACAASQVDSLGYRATVTDDDTGNIVAEKAYAPTRRSDWRERRRLDVLVIDVSGGRSSDTRLSVQARSFTEYQSRRGPTRQDVKASNQVEAAARTLVEACGSAGAA